MSLSPKEITKIAKLARIRITAAEGEHYAKEISGILNWVEQLQEVNTDNVPQLMSVANVELPWRKDEVNDGGQQAAIVKNAPKAEYGCFAVPKVIE